MMLRPAKRGSVLAGLCLLAAIAAAQAPGGPGGGNPGPAAPPAGGSPSAGGPSPGGPAGALPLPSAGGSAVDNAQLLEMLKEKALVFNVKALVANDQQVLWSADQTRVTVHGLSVTIRLESTDLLILAELTPYRVSNEAVMLVVRSELWLRSSKENTVQYFASMKSAQVRLNDLVYFYPLGKVSGEGKTNIRLDITVSAYRETKD